MLRMAGRYYARRTMDHAAALARPAAG
jgi:hypothetical protein